MAITHQEPWGQSAIMCIVNADPTAGLAANVGSLAILDTGLASWLKVGAGNTAWERITGSSVIADPGNAGAIPVTLSGTCALTSAGAETRTLAIPTFLGQRLQLSCDVYVGNIVTTVAAAFDAAGSTTITMNGAGDFVSMESVQVAGALVWRIIENQGCALA